VVEERDNDARKRCQDVTHVPYRLWSVSISLPHPPSLILLEGDGAARLLSCQALLSLLQAHLRNLNSTLGQHRSISGDREARASARLCIIISLIKQAELCNDMHQNSLPSAPERVQYRSTCREHLAEAVHVMTELSPDDYYYLDPYLGVGPSTPYYIPNLLTSDLATRFVAVERSAY
jgi:hypothetical protein